MKILIIFVFGFLLIGISLPAIAQNQTQPSKHLMREDSAAVNALVMYPDTIRLHIFEACEYPAAIVSIASLQKKTSDDFANFVSGYSKSEQEDFWNLARYPDLISKIAQGEPKTEDQINAILVDYPADIHETAIKYGTDYFDQLQKIDAMQSQTDAQFQQIISDYSPETQQALRDIIQYPEIISLLNDHLSLTVRVGDRFRRNPERVIHRADSLNFVETKQNAEDAATWKETIQQNPDEANDLQQAADDYATENGYSQEDVNTEPSTDAVTNYTCSPYSYWFGYPTWYPYDYWYPYPFWFDCGFYRDHSGKMVIFGSPSYYFTNWYFYHPENWNRYPGLGNAYINHYYRSARTVGANTIIVHNWVRDNKNYLPKDFVHNTSNRSAVIKQVAQLNIDVRKQKGVKTVTPAVRDQYFQNNRTKYPSLNVGQKITTEPEEKQRGVPDIIQQPERQPAVRIHGIVQEGSWQQPVKTSPAPPVKVQQNVQHPVARPTPTPPVRNFNDINKAQEYHRNVWEQTQPVAHPQQQAAPRTPAPQPVRQQPVNREPTGKRK